MAKLIPFSSMLDDFFTDEFPFRRSLANDTFKVDIKEDEKNYYVEAELPGVKKEELKVAIKDGRLKISVEHEEKVEEEKKNYIHKERKYCSMERNMMLADAAETGITAKLTEGVLEIVIPKKESTIKTTDIKVE